MKEPPPTQILFSKSFLHVGNVVVRRQDTARARVQVLEPLVRDLRVAQVFNSCHLLPGTCGEECVLQTLESSPISESRKLRLELRRTDRLFWGAEKSISSPSSSWEAERGMFQGCSGLACGTRSLQSLDSLLPGFVCCLSRPLNMQLRRGLIFIIKDAEMSGGGCFDDRGKASLQEVLWKKACPDCVLDHCLDARLGSPSVQKP